MASNDNPCPCGADASLSLCCGRFIFDQCMPDTAEQLMRSRYTAFVLQDEAYLKKTWHPDTCPACIDLDANTQWLGLKIKSAQAGAQEDGQGVVEFVARYKVNGRGYRLHEISRFVRRDGQWLYLDGEQVG